MKTFLVVDDSGVVRRVARRILERLSFGVDEAANGRIALEACQARMPDAVLLDWNMPEMSGIEFLRRLRRAPGGTAPIVVFCTTEGDIAHIQEAIGAGASDYIVKPFDDAILRAKLRTVGLL